MGHLELIVGAALGLAIGLWAGQFLRALLIYWESADVAVKSLKSTVFFLVGGGGGATLTSVFVSRGATTCYLGGLALGLLVGRCVPLPRARSPKATEHGFTAARRLPGNLKPSDDVDLLIRLRMDPPRRVQRELRVGEKELARRIEAALDTWAELEEPPPADDEDGGGSVRSETNQDVWPPPDAAAFIRSEAFGQLVLDVAAALARRYRRMDFTNAAARVFVWFDRKVAEDPQFLSAKRFPRPSALRAYLRQALWNDARRTERDERRQRALAQVGFDEPPDEWGVSPEDAVMLQELLDRLPSLHRRIVQALVFGEQTIANLSVALGVSKRRVAALFREAIDRLRTGWEEEQRR